MITAGIDMGSKFVKVVILKDGTVQAKASDSVGFEPAAVAERCLETVAKASGIEVSAIDHITSTGAGRKAAPSAHSDITDVGAAAKGVVSMYPEARTVIDIGAEEGRGIKVNADSSSC